MTDYNERLTLIVAADKAPAAREYLMEHAGGDNWLEAELYLASDPFPRTVAAYINSGPNLGQATWEAFYAVDSLYCGTGNPDAAIESVGLSKDNGIV